MIKNIEERASANTRSVVEGKVKVGVAVIKIPKGDLVVERQEDVKGNKIPYVKYNGALKEVVSQSADKKSYFIRVNKDEEPQSFGRSVPWFVLPPELEAIYGKRATEIKIMFIAETLEEIIPSGYKKYSFGSIVCFGDGMKARRYNEITQEWGDVPCICAYSKTFERDAEPRVNEVTMTEVLPQRKLNRRNSSVDQVLVQGAWREIKSYDKDKNKLFLVPLEDACGPRYILRFINTETDGINLITFDGGGESNLMLLISQINGFKKIFGKISGIPLFLRVRMEEKKSKKYGTTKVPMIYLHLPHSVDKMMESQLQKKINGVDTPETKTLESHISSEDADFVMDDETETVNPLED